MTTFYQVTSTCPVCNADVSVHHVTSTTTGGPTYSDFRRDAIGFQPRNLVVSLCRDCGFAGYNHEFKIENVLPEDVRDKITAHIYPRLPLPEDTIPTSKVYGYIGRIHGWLNKPPLKVVDSYLRAAWCAQDEKDPAGEKEYRLIAISYYKEALGDHTILPKQHPEITYLIGEMYRRVGEPDHAAEYFDTVLENARTHAHWEKFVDLARRQRDNPSDTL